MTDPWTQIPLNTVFAAPGGDLILDLNNGPASDLVINPGSTFMKARIVYLLRTCGKSGDLVIA